MSNLLKNKQANKDNFTSSLVKFSQTDTSNSKKITSPSSKEWNNSIYSYNKNYVKLLVYKDKLVNYLFKSYFNLTKKILNKKRFRFNSKRFTSNRIFLSNAEIKHTNSNVNITLFLFNKNKNFMKYKLSMFKTKLYKLDKLKWNIFKNRLTKIFIFNIKSFKTNLYSQIKVFAKYMKKNLMLKTNILYNISKNEKFSNYTIFYLINKIKNNIVEKEKINNNWRNLFIAYINRKKKLVKNVFAKLRTRKYNSRYYRFLKKNRPTLLNKKTFRAYKFLYYYQTLLFNRNKFTNWFLNYKSIGLINIISKIYNKNVEFNIVNLKSMHLNSNIYSEAIALKLRNRNNRLLRVLKKSLFRIKLPRLFDLCNPNNNIVISSKRDLLNSIKYKLVSGVRFETSGRLSRRLVASRSVFKFRYVGSLRNIYSSYIGLSSVMLRGYLKSNIQYTIINSKTRNGAFGLKGWTSSY